MGDCLDAPQHDAVLAGNPDFPADRSSHSCNIASHSMPRRNGDDEMILIRQSR